MTEFLSNLAILLGYIGLAIASAGIATLLLKAYNLLNSKFGGHFEETNKKEAEIYQIDLTEDD